MSAPTPDTSELVGRSEELAFVAGAIEARGCLLAGVAGVGKSRLAGEAASASGRLVHRVHATQSARHLPMGAISHLFPSTADDGVPPIQAFLEELRRLDPDGGAVLVVDDAQLLDDGSAAAILAAASAGVAKVVATIRTPEATPDAVDALWRSGLLPRLEIQPLGLADTRRLLTQLLGGDAHALTLERIHEVSGGNPLFITELVRDGQPAGAFAQEDGRWVWRPQRVRYERLGHLIEERLAQLSPDGRRVLEAMAIASPISLDRLVELVGDDAVAEVERRHLVTVEGNPPIARFGHPLFGEVIASEMPVSVGRRLRRELIELVLEQPRDENEVLQAATWALEEGEADPSLLIDASRVALRRGSPLVAHRLTESVGDSFPGVLARAQALLGLARFDDASAVLADHEEAAAREPVDTSAAYAEVRFRSLLRGSQPFDIAAEFAGRVARWHEGPRWDALVASFRGWLDLYARRPRDAAQEVAAASNDRTLEPAHRYPLLVVHAMACSRLGQADRCEEIEAELHHVIGLLEPRPWEASVTALLADFETRCYAGRDVEAVATRLSAERTHAKEIGDRALVTVLDHALGVAAQTRGHIGVAADHFRAAQDGLEIGDPYNIAATNAVLLAFALGQSDDGPSAAGALDQTVKILDRQPSQAMRLGLVLERATAWVAVANRRLVDAVRSLEALVDLTDQDVMVRAYVLHDLVRLGASANRPAHELQALAEETTHDVVEVYAAHADAVHRDDAVACLSAAERFGALGFDLYAAEAAAHASTMFRRQALGRRAGEAELASLEYRGRCAGASTPALEIRQADDPKLTPRERDVAALVAEGCSNAAIAEQLVLSVRTVETYVLRACQKYGVTSREELAARLLGA